MYKLKISSTFVNMVENIISYYALYSIKYSCNIRVSIYNAINILETYPYAFQQISSQSALRKCVIKGRFSIIYKIEQDEVELLYFLDSRRLNNSYVVEEEKELYYVC